MDIDFQIVLGYEDRELFFSCARYSVWKRAKSDILEKRMNSIFVSHSRRDKKLLASFDRVFAQVGVPRVLFEFEEASQSKPAWHNILERIRESDAVFLLLGANVVRTRYTQNWVAFEVGISSAFQKPVWVFESSRTVVEFPIPYLNAYFVFDDREIGVLSTQYKMIKGIIESFKPGESSKRLKGAFVGCADCGVEFMLYPEDIVEFVCPSCRHSQQRMKKGR